MENLGFIRQHYFLLGRLSRINASTRKIGAPRKNFAVPAKSFASQLSKKLARYGEIWRDMAILQATAPKFDRLIDHSKLRRFRPISRQTDTLSANSCQPITMSPSPLSSAALAAINHVLAQEAWARAKLAEHAGKTVCLDASLIQFTLQVSSDGLLQTSQATQPDVTLHLKLADLPWIMQNRERAFSSVKVAGDAEFASVLAHLAQNVRWEAEHDLQRFVGEIAARRLVQGGKQALDMAKQGQQKLHENVAEYFLEENPMLVRPQAVEYFGAEVAKLRDDVERFEKRLQRLEHKLNK